MLPASPTNDCMNVRCLYAELNGEIALQHSFGKSLSYLAHIIFGQFCLSMIFTFAVGSHFMIVLSILLLGSPHQIGESTIGFNPIQMAAFHSFRDITILDGRIDFRHDGLSVRSLCLEGWTDHESARPSLIL